MLGLSDVFIVEGGSWGLEIWVSIVHRLVEKFSSCDHCLVESMQVVYLGIVSCFFCWIEQFLMK